MKIGSYIYAIADPALEKSSLSCKGISDKPIRTISVGKATAIYSDVPNQKIRPERRHLSAHQNVLKYLFNEGTILPMAFGIIADSPKAVQSILSRYQHSFSEQLQRVNGKAEMGIRISWDVPNIFEYFIAQYADLREMRDALLAERGHIGRGEMIELGRQFDRILNEVRDEYREKIEASLAEHCYEIKHNPPKKETEIMNLACLVEKEKLQQFEKALLEVSSQYNDDFAVHYSGPWPPHNFIDLVIEA